MTTKCEKAKPQKSQLNKQLEAAVKKPEMENTWIENLGKLSVGYFKICYDGCCNSILVQRYGR